MDVHLEGAVILASALLRGIGSRSSRSSSGIVAAGILVARPAAVLLSVAFATGTTAVATFTDGGIAPRQMGLEAYPVEL